MATGHTTRRDVDYGPSDLDLYPPTARCNAPIVVFVHGGGYCCGDKTEIKPNLVQWVNAQGYVFVSVNYRVRVRYPAFDDDVAAAIAWARRNAPSFGGDPNRITLLGHSTGGNMVAEIGTTPARLASAGLSSASLRCVGVLDGSTLDLAATMQHPPSSTTNSMIRNAYGTTPTDWVGASAYANADDTNNVRRFLVVKRGTKLAVQQGFADRLRSHGSAVTVVDASSIDHGQVINDIGRNGDRVMTAPMQSFLRTCFGG